MLTHRKSRSANLPSTLLAPLSPYRGTEERSSTLLKHLWFSGRKRYRISVLPEQLEFLRLFLSGRIPKIGKKYSVSIHTKNYFFRKKKICTRIRTIKLRTQVLYSNSPSHSAINILKSLNILWRNKSLRVFCLESFNVCRPSHSDPCLSVPPFLHTLQAQFWWH